MLAAAKEDTIRFVQYEGIHDDYPDWFNEAIMEGVVVDEFDCGIYYADDGEMALTEGDIFLLNKHGQLRYISLDDFTDEFYHTDCWDEQTLYAAAKSDVIEAVVYEGWNEDAYPSWFVQGVLNYVVFNSEYECPVIRSHTSGPSIGGEVYFINGELALVEEDVFLVNKEGRIWKLDLETFNDEFWVVD